MEEDFKKKTQQHVFNLILAFLPPFCFPRMNLEGMKTWVCPKLFYVIIKQM